MYVFIYIHKYTHKLHSLLAENEHLALVLYTYLQAKLRAGLAEHIRTYSEPQWVHHGQGSAF